MRIAGRITSMGFPRPSSAGICLALPSADQLSRTNFSFLLITRASALITQAHRLRIPCSPPPSAVGTLALSARLALTPLETALGRVRYITRAYPLPNHVPFLPPPRRPAVLSRSTEFPLR